MKSTFLHRGQRQLAVRLFCLLADILFTKLTSLVSRLSMFMTYIEIAPNAFLGKYVALHIVQFA